MSAADNGERHAVNGEAINLWHCTIKEQLNAFNKILNKGTLGKNPRYVKLRLLEIRNNIDALVTKLDFSEALT